MDVINNEAAKRYEINKDGQTAVLEYIPAGSSIVFSHTEVPQGLEGQGIGGRLVKYGLEEVKASGKKVIPMCPFVAQYIKSHPEYRELVFGHKPRE